MSTDHNDLYVDLGRIYIGDVELSTREAVTNFIEQLNNLVNDVWPIGTDEKEIQRLALQADHVRREELARQDKVWNATLKIWNMWEKDDILKTI